MPPRPSEADNLTRQALVANVQSNVSSWPGSSSSRPSPLTLVTPQSIGGASQSTARPSPMRLVVTQSLILPRKQRVAVFDGHPEVSIGRDISPDPTAPRLRLKEMGVSKFHASFFFSFSSRTWSLVDLGSVHGTTVNGVRLSGARQSSQPRELRHTDTIVVGTTTLVVHTHRDGLPCTDCAVVNNGDNEIPLFDAKSREVGVPGKPRPPQPQLSARSAITTLRQQLVPAAERSVTSASLSDDNVARPEYKDRAAMRRARHPQHAEPPPRRPQERPSHPPAPVVAPNEPSLALSGTAVSFTFRRSSPSPNTHSSAQAEPVSAPEKPLESSNVGHQLLLKQGWTPGTGLGLAEDARVVPVTVERLAHRAGLGVGSASSASGVSASSGDDYGHRQSSSRASRQRQKWGSGNVPKRTTGGSRKSDRERERDEGRDQNERDRDRHRERSRRHPSDEDRVHLHKMRAAEETEIADALGRAGLQDRRVATSAFSSPSSLSVRSAPAYAPGQDYQQGSGSTSPQQSVGSSRSSRSPPAQFFPGRSSSPPPSIFAASSPSESSSRHSSMQPSSNWSRDGSAQPQHQAQSSVSSFSSVSSGMQPTPSNDGSPLTSADHSHASSTLSFGMELTRAAISQHSTSEGSGGGTTATQSSKDGSSDPASQAGPVSASFVYQSSIFKSRSRKMSSSKSTPIPANSAPRPDPHSLDNILPRQKQPPHINLFSRHTMMSIVLPKGRPRHQPTWSSGGSSKGGARSSGSGTATEGSVRPDNSPSLRMRRLSAGDDSIQEDDETSRTGQNSPPEATMEEPEGSGTRQGSPMEGVAGEASSSSYGSPMQIEDDEEEEHLHDTALLHDPNNLQSGGWGHTFKMISPSANDADTSQNPQPTLSSVPPDRINL